MLRSGRNSMRNYINWGILVLGIMRTLKHCQERSAKTKSKPEEFASKVEFNPMEKFITKTSLVLWHRLSNLQMESRLKVRWKEKYQLVLKDGCMVVPSWWRCASNRGSSVPDQRTTSTSGGSWRALWLTRTTTVSTCIRVWIPVIGDAEDKTLRFNFQRTRRTPSNSPPQIQWSFWRLDVVSSPTRKSWEGGLKTFRQQVGIQGKENRKIPSLWSGWRKVMMPHVMFRSDWKTYGCNSKMWSGIWLCNMVITWTTYYGEDFTRIVLELIGALEQRMVVDVEMGYQLSSIPKVNALRFTLVMKRKHEG